MSFPSAGRAKKVAPALLDSEVDQLAQLLGRLDALGDNFFGVGRWRLTTSAPVRILEWSQIDAWRMARAHLTSPASPPELAGVVARAGGMQAQILSAAELALSARVPALRRADVARALWEQRTLVKCHGPRGTLHLLAADDVAPVMAAMRNHPRWNDEALAPSFGELWCGIEALVAAVTDALDGRQLTRAELADEVVARLGAWAGEPLRSGWGTLLAPVAFAGRLCFGPNRGSSVTFVRTDQWLGSWCDHDPGTALADLVRRFLAAYGPASEAEVAEWLAMAPAQVRPTLERLAPELEAVDVDGRRRLILRADLAGPWPGGTGGPALKLLPQYDSYVLGHRQRDRLVPPLAKARIAADPKGRLEHVVGVPVVLVDGVVGGLWRRKLHGRRLTVTVEPTTRLSRVHRQLLDEEVARVGAYLEARSVETVTA